MLDDPDQASQQAQRIAELEAAIDAQVKATSFQIELRQAVEAQAHELIAKGSPTIQALLATVSDLNRQLMTERAHTVRITSALVAIRDECFGCMEGAGMPEFEHYADWHALAHFALQERPTPQDPCRINL